MSETVNPDMTSDGPLHELAGRAWELHAAASRSHTEVCNPSIPILYFGDYAAYAQSPTRVITVGLNPSRVEFPADDPWRRFPGGDRIAPSATQCSAYLELLRRYFVTAPYDAWFGGGFEPLLKGLGTSYYPRRAESVALHTDVCTPLATDPTWSRLASATKLALGVPGLALWRDLVEVLRPHLLVISVAARYVAALTEHPTGSWTPVYTVERDRPYHVRARRIRIGELEPAVVFGQAAQLPFGTISHAERRRAGTAVRRFLDG